MVQKVKEKGGIDGICYLGTLNSQYELYIVNKKLYLLEQTENNTEQAFVAISSFITSYSRMLLIKYLKQAKRENVYYMDTDSLITNKEGYTNLINEIDTYQLGKLKLEGVGSCQVYAPKFYDFDIKTPYKDLPQEVKQVFLYGSGKKLSFEWDSKTFTGTLERVFEGIIPHIERALAESKSAYRKTKIHKNFRKLEAKNRLELLKYSPILTGDL